MRIAPDCRDPELLAAEVRRLRTVIAAGEPTLTAEEREAIEAIVPLARRNHNDCDDTWYGCPLSDGGCSDPAYAEDECNCGALAHNEKVDALAVTLRNLMERLK
jgi:hypothetical protein